MWLRNTIFSASLVVIIATNQLNVLDGDQPDSSCGCSGSSTLVRDPLTEGKDTPEIVGT